MTLFRLLLTFSFYQEKGETKLNERIHEKNNINSNLDQFDDEKIHNKYQCN